MSSDAPANATATPPAPPAPPKRASGGPSIVSMLALLIAVTTACYVVFRDPPWGHLGKYDYSSPEQALRSDMRIRANGDMPALIELEGQMLRKAEKERLASLEVKRTAEFKGKTALFIQFKSTDKNSKEEKERKQVVWYAKDDVTGRWERTDLGEDIRQLDKKLAQDIAEWQGWPGIGMPPFPE
jgi:hypothetical protein